MEEVAQAIIIIDGKYLAVKEVDDIYWKLPGGKLENKETVEQALERELKEEIGITDFNIESRLSIFELPYKERYFRFYPFIITTNQIPCKTEENLTLAWLFLNRMLDKDQASSLNIIYSKLKDIGLIN